ncbi:hypothetical protein N3K66_008342 [Trichothecium roseum]|uniref:Uncharacterized protein n=1 Tax=Trichothecium roseum TaxID=47278 RepID=A0ACC0UQ58_9HYPO|nr:hypothetical protein N3K66_008342 [Trichothecium roseum]
MTTSTASDFHIAIVSNDSNIFPSFPSKALSAGDATKITLADIRKYANVSQKLKFTADGKTTLGDDTTLSYYMSLRGDSPSAEKASQDNDTAPDSNKPEVEAGKAPAVKTVQVDLILNKAGGGDGKGSTPAAVDLSKIQENIDKVIDKMKTDGTVTLGDLTKLSDSLGPPGTDSMNFAAQAGNVTYPEALDLTEVQWQTVFRNNRALHGWIYKGNLLVKARKQGRSLSAFHREQEPIQSDPIGQPPPAGSVNSGPPPAITSGSEKPGSLPPVPPFYVWDDATVEVTEMTSALETTMANQGFSSTAIKATGGGGQMGAEATASLAVEKEHSAANQTLDVNKVNSVHVAYQFPRAAVDLDAYCLELTDECKKQALDCRTAADVDRWEREYGTVFATHFTLGGELTSSRLFHGSDVAELSTVKDSVKVAAGLSITSPYGSGGFSYGSSNSSETSKGERAAQQSMRLAWQARGGDTLLCSNPPLWASTVKDYRLWRIMDQEGMVSMLSLVKSVNAEAGKFLENPESSSKDHGDEDKRVWGLLNVILKDTNPNPVADKVKAFYEGDGFKVEEYNASLGTDGQELKLDEKVGWSTLDLEQKLYVGMLGYKKKQYTLE